ncbi:hypothetical protein IGI39_004234 [Enterococcus sp. AZ135]|uniref:hypothetical protein n=1 Tax=unclassified Enterococcus TaxID=2608891 RepID=UPI003F2861F9
MIITEIKKEHDDQSLDQLAELMMHLYGISLMGACGLLEKALDECQLTVGIFDRGRMLGVVFGKKINQADWLVSPLFISTNLCAVEKAGNRLLRFIENEINYRDGANIHLLLEAALFFDVIGLRSFSKRPRRIATLPKSFYLNSSYCCTCSLSPLSEVLLKKIV